MSAVLADNKAGILADGKSVLEVFSDHIKFIIFKQASLKGFVVYGE